jgi:hypothetical protein
MQAAEIFEAAGGGEGEAVLIFGIEGRGVAQHTATPAAKRGGFV